VIVDQIKDHYFEIKAGIGLYKSPKLYGAFPTDPYSHTPAHAGAQQPGMTGQVKEDFISRMRELGVHISDGKIEFQSTLFNPNELLTDNQIFEYFDINGEEQQIKLSKGQLGLTFCQIPVIYTASDKNKIKITLSDGSRVLIAGHSIDSITSALVFGRTGEVRQIDVSFQSF
jgi:hypothetical protein